MAVTVFDRVRSVVSASQAFTEPIHSAGVTVVGVARVAGGGGGEMEADGSSDGGLGLVARPVGAYVIQDGKVRFIPAVDVTRVLVVAAVIVAIILIRRARRKRRRQAAAQPAAVISQ